MPMCFSTSEKRGLGKSADAGLVHAELTLCAQSFLVFDRTHGRIDLNSDGLGAVGTRIGCHLVVFS